ncbi:MAG: tRNA (adenosine(37)-N6)-dimethylallyltransferase MiaA [Thermoleophilaceae bacterium]|nr:tRNA (adenosine(37)-N6)-dimethylallyltransferase MiaA [Thermoleophilaceae bacterium]
MAGPGAPLIAIFGPTGVGKTAVAVEVAKRLKARGEDPVAISADAIQVYEGLAILSGSASAEEQAQLEHRLISFVPIWETFSAGRFAELAHTEIDAALAGGRSPLVVGGTGLYLRAALAHLEMGPPAPPAVRASLERELEAVGLRHLYARLAEIAPARAARIGHNDRSRVLRALELLEMDAPPAVRAGAGELWTDTTRVPTRLFGLVRDRDDLYARIEARVEDMVALGAEEEVRLADAAGASATARAAIGFEELLVGDVERMQRRTRQYAKRQLTWMRKLPGVELIDVTAQSPTTAAATIVAALAEA